MSVIGLNHPAREARVGNRKKQTTPDGRRKEDTACSVGGNTFRGTYIYVAVWVGIYSTVGTFWEDCCEIKK